MQFIRLFCLLTTIAVACSSRDEKTLGETVPAADSIEAEFPIMIDGGRKIVYQFTKMTPRGVRYFLDTIDYRDDPSRFAALNPNYLFPLDLTAAQRNNSPAVIAISLPGYFEETIFGLIDEHDALWIRYKDVLMGLHSTGMTPFAEENFKCTFKNDSIRVDLQGVLNQTATGTHRAGKAELRIYENDTHTKSFEVFVVAR